MQREVFTLGCVMPSVGCNLQNCPFARTSTLHKGGLLLGDAGPAALVSVGRPPLILYDSFKRAARFLKQAGIPAVIDHSVFVGRFGQGAAPLVEAITFLALVDANGLPQHPNLERFLDALDTAAWPGDLAMTLKRAYSPIKDCDLSTATMQQLVQKFGDVYGLSHVLARRGISFFLGAARDAQIPLSSYLYSKRGGSPDAQSSQRAPVPGKNRKRSDEHTLADLVEKFPAFDANWSDDVKLRWLECFRDVLSRFD